MAQWGKTDTAADAPLWIGAYAKRKANTTTRDAMFGNSTVHGVFAVNAAEAAGLDGKVAHTGWVRRTVGTGGRAGRVQTEVLIAGGITGADAADDAVIPDAVIKITTQPASKNVASGATTFAVVSVTEPAGVPQTYQWQANTGSGFTNLTNTGVYSNVTTATLSISSVTGLTGVQYRAVINATGAATKTSNAATLTVA